MITVTIIPWYNYNRQSNVSRTMIPSKVAIRYRKTARRSKRIRSQYRWAPKMADGRILAQICHDRADPIT